MKFDPSACRNLRQRRNCIALALALGLAGMAAPTHAKPSAGHPPSASHGPVLVLGDSLSAEYGLARGKGWVSLLQARLQAGTAPQALVNASVSGETSAGGRSRLPALLRQHKPSVVLIELGGNDALRGLALQSTQANLRAMVQAAKQSQAKVLLVGMQVPPNYGTGYTRQFEAMFRQIASAEGVPLVPFLLAGIGDAADAEQWFQPDRIHPNARAQPRMLENVWPTLKPLLN